VSFRCYQKLTVADREGVGSRVSAFYAELSGSKRRALSALDEMIVRKPLVA
jgi:hypothetical protein